MAKKRKPRKLNKKELRSQKRIEQSGAGLMISENLQEESSNDSDEQKSIVQKRTVELAKIITIRELAEKFSLPVTTILEELLKNGIISSINESIDFDTASIIGLSLGFDVQPEYLTQAEEKRDDAEEGLNLQPRSAVVVVLGHVDHGKTTLLDQIRKSDVASHESGGITQHIGAYQVELRLKVGAKSRGGEADRGITRNTRGDFTTKARKITFLDTPGHEAFSAMRAHGANITDIAILVIAADDGVKPQTKEAISHAKAADIPIIVAINKIDKPEADIERVKRELSELDLIPEEWGGKTVMLPISAKQNQGIEELLDMVLVTADLMELKADYDQLAKGIVIESHMQIGIGPLATVLVQNGRLRVGQDFVVGKTFGRIKRMEDYQGKVIDEAIPSMPVRIAGLKDLPNFGEHFEVVENEKIAKLKAQAKTLRIMQLGIAELSKKIKSGEMKNLNIILKVDTQGSLEAIKNSLANIGDDELKIKVIHHAVGDINESDINLAIASNALVVGFGVKSNYAAKNLAQMKGVKISNYDVIYQLIDDLTQALKGLIEPEIVEVILGKLEVLKIFRSKDGRQVIGAKVVDGQISSGSKFYHYHSGEKTASGKIVSLQVGPTQVNQVEKGFECGLGVEISTTIKPSDIIQAYQLQENIKRI